MAIDPASRRAAKAHDRSAMRFPLRLPIAIKALSPPLLPGPVLSQTLSVWSGGLSFSTEASFEPEQLVRIALKWPARLGNLVALDLVVDGRILECGQGTATVEFGKYEFRTRKSESGERPSAPGPAGSRSAGHAA